MRSSRLWILCISFFLSLTLDWWRQIKLAYELHRIRFASIGMYDIKNSSEIIFNSRLLPKWWQVDTREWLHAAEKPSIHNITDFIFSFSQERISAPSAKASQPFHSHHHTPRGTSVLQESPMAFSRSSRTSGSKLVHHFCRHTQRPVSRALCAR